MFTLWNVQWDAEPLGLLFFSTKELIKDSQLCILRVYSTKTQDVSQFGLAVRLTPLPIIMQESLCGDSGTSCIVPPTSWDLGPRQYFRKQLSIKQA